MKEEKNREENVRELREREEQDKEQAKSERNGNGPNKNVRPKKIIASLLVAVSMAVIAIMAGNLIILSRTTQAMNVDWDDWISNRDYEDSFTLSVHVQDDMRQILRYIGLKQLLEEADGSLNLDRPALVVMNAEGRTETYTMRELVAMGEELGIYVYDGGVSRDDSYDTYYGYYGYEDSYIQYNISYNSADRVQVLWSLMDAQDASAGIGEDVWAVRQQKIDAALEAPHTLSALVPGDEELTLYTTQELIDLARGVLGENGEGDILTESLIDGWQEELDAIRRNEGSGGGLSGEMSSPGTESTEEELAADISSEEESLRSAMQEILNSVREEQLENSQYIQRLCVDFLLNYLQDYYDCHSRIDGTDSNLSWQIVLTSGEASKTYSDADTAAAGESLALSQDMNVYYAYNSTNQRIDSTLQSWTWDEFISMLKNYTYLDYTGSTIVCGLNTADMAYEDAYSVERDSYLGYRSSVFGSVGAMAACLVIILAAMIWLMFLSGHREGVEGIYLNGFDRIPTEPAACLIFALALGFAAMLWLIASVVQGYETIGQSNGRLIISACLALETLVLYLILWLGFYGLVRRVKAHRLWKNSLTARFLRWCLRPIRFVGRQLRRLWDLLLNAGDTTWKTLAVFAAYFVVNYVWGTSLEYAGALSLLLYLLFNAAVAVFLVWKGFQKKQIYQGVKKIADGNLSYHLPLQNLSGADRKVAEQVNRIGTVLKEAIDTSVKNERMKTDLITNVSHDLKTPLTSIINYVDLLKRENIQDPKVQGYIEVLENKAQRLKTLTEDLLEASKASSGTLQLNLEKINFIELINQTNGEFMDRFQACGLTVVPDIPETSAYIMADGRYVWRILENLYRNAEKYAMPGTRLYIDVFEKFGRIFFVMKNISQAPLNIKAEELTERFIRGDVSRSTEGSGLGLSIAKDMTELMDGTFKIYLDGDLFRVTISFAVIPDQKPDLKEMEENIRRRMNEETGQRAEGSSSGYPEAEAAGGDVRMGGFAAGEEEGGKQKPGRNAGKGRAKGLFSRFSRSGKGKEGRKENKEEPTEE